MKPPPHWRQPILAIVLALSLLLALAAALRTDSPPSDQPRSARAEAQAAWQRARDAGSYAFTADVLQRTIPLPTVTNVGRRSRQDALRLEGETNLREQTLRLNLWSQGGSLLNAEDGLEVRVEGGRTLARRGSGVWEEIDDFTGAFAPEGDFLAFLVAADDITRLSAETRAGVTFTRYTFRVDGPRFAAYVRDQMEKHLAERGELPPGVTLDLPRAYVNMTGAGELWIGADGLPLRQILNLQFPEQDEHRVEAEVTVDFSGFGLVSASATTQDSLTHQFSIWAGRQLGKAALILAMAALGLVVVTHSRSRTVYTSLTLALIISMVVSPLLQSNQVAAFNDRQTARAKEQERQQKEDEAQRALSDSLADSDFDPHTDPLAAAAMTNADRASWALGAANALVAAQTTPETALCRVAGSEFSPTTTTDLDEDGLTDYQECLLGTSLRRADTDGDLITDTLEVRGFPSPNPTWYSDPLEIDTNRDGLGDAQEWFLDANDDLQPDDSDDDGTPDLFDDDNDGDGVPDRLDLSPFQASARVDSDGRAIETAVFDEAKPLSLIVGGLQAGQPTYVEFQVRPTQPERLWYAYNVLDWPQGDSAGQMQDIDGGTFADVSPDPIAAGFNGDLKLVPLLEIVISGDTDNLPPSETRTITDPEGQPVTTTVYPELDHYGIFVKTLQRAGSSAGLTETVKAVYVPLQLVTDARTGAHTAFEGKMLYRPAPEWGNAQQVRLAWAILALVDVCQDEEEGETCTQYGLNQPQIAQVYYDDWFLTGLNVRENHGAEIAIIYEDPAVDPDLDDDTALMELAVGLDHSLLVGRDCDTTSASGPCVGDGQPDITIDEIYRRFNRLTNDSVLEAERWGIPDILGVVPRAYAHVDEAIVTTAMTETQALLTSVFTMTTPVTPTLMFARVERTRTLNLEEQDRGPAIAWEGATLTLEMNDGPAPDVGRPVETLAGVTWAPYRRVGGLWEAAPIREYVTEEFPRRYPAPSLPGESLGEFLSRRMIAQIYYLGLYYGALNVIQSGAQLLTLVSFFTPDADLQEFLEKISGEAGGQGAEFVTSYILESAFPDVPIVEILGGQVDIVGGDFVFGGDFDFYYGQANTSALLGAAGVLLGLANIGVFIAKLVVDDPETLAVLTVVNQVLSIALNALALLTAVITMISRIWSFVVTGSTLLGAVRSVLSGVNLTRASAVAGAIGLIISLAIIWGFFLYAVFSQDLDPASPGFYLLLATSYAATIIVVLFFVLSLSNPVVALLVTIAGLLDAIFWTSCAVTVEGSCFTITGWLIENLAEAFYGLSAGATVEVTDTQSGALSAVFADPSRGLRADNPMRVASSITTTIAHLDPGEDLLTLVVKRFNELPEFWTVDKLESTEINYAFSAVPETLTTEWETAEDHVFAYTWLGDDLTQQMYRGTNRATVTGEALLVAGVNVRPALTLVARYDLHGVQCTNTATLYAGTFNVCHDQVVTDTLATDVDPGQVLDIFPATLAEFYGLTWGAWRLAVPNYVDDSATFRSGGLAFAAQRDHDGDGLISPIHGGNDPDDATWDTDHDGLSDARERSLQAEGIHVSPNEAHSDDDGLSDSEEARLGTNPGWPDSDGDGLTDSEEVEGWDFAAGPGLVARATSHPLVADTDGDGMSDKAERDLHLSDPAKFPYHPRVFNEQPVALYTRLGGAGVVTDQGQTFARPGAQLAYTTTVRNNIGGDLYAQGTLTVAMPTRLGGSVHTHTLDYFGGVHESFRTDATVGGGPSQSVGITDTVFAQLQPDSPASSWALQTISSTILFPEQDPARPRILHSAMAPLVDGHYMLVSIEREPVAEKAYVVVRDSRSPGSVVELGNINQNFVPAYHEFIADIACASNGNCLAVWSAYDGNDYQIRGAIYAAATATWSSLGAISFDPDREIENLRPSVATDGADFVVAWIAEGELDFEGESRRDVWARRVANDGTVSAEHLSHRIETSLNGDLGSDPLDVAWAGADRYVVAWGDQTAENFTSLTTAFLNGDGSVSDRTVVLSGNLVTALQVALDPASQASMIAEIMETDSVPRMVVVGVTPNGVLSCLTAIADDNPHTAAQVAFHPNRASWIVAYADAPASGDVTIVYQAMTPVGTVVIPGGNPVCDSRTDPKTYTQSNIVPESLALACATGECAFTGFTSRPQSSIQPALKQVFLNRFDLLEIPPGQGELGQSLVDQVMVDNDLPVSAFDGALYYLQALPDPSTFILGGAASDLTSGVRQVEVSVNNGDWQPATGLGAWTFALDVPAGEGVHVLRSRATDLVGNEQSAFQSATIVVDGGAPQLGTNLADGDLVDVITEAPNQRLTVPLSGTVFDPNVASEPGSGMRLVEVNLSPNGSGWLPAVLTTTTPPNGYDWFIAYPLAALDENNQPLLDPTGRYTLTVRAADNVGNQIAEAHSLTRTLRIEATPPVARLTSIGDAAPGDVLVITDTLLLRGVVSESGSLRTGLSGVDVSFTDRQPETPVQTWQAAALAASGPGVFSTTWTHPIPADLEGFYQIDARGADVAGNLNEDQSTWGQWAGEIDALAPRVVVTATHLGTGSTARTRYELTAADLNLDEASIQFAPCAGRGRIERRYYDTEWYRASGGDPRRLFEVTHSCTRPGHQTESFTVRVCDLYGHCAELVVIPSGTFTTSGNAARSRGKASVLSVTAQQQSVPPLLDAFIFEPEDASVLTASNPISVSGGAYARDYLRALTVTVDGGVIYTQGWAANTVTDTTWATSWTPSGEGPHAQLAVVSDWAGRTLTDTSPNIVTLDTQPPTVSITNTLANISDRVASNRADILGQAADLGGVAAVDVRIGGGPWDRAFLESTGPGTVAWRYPWVLDLTPNNSYLVTARATDIAGRTALVTQTITVDLTPPDPVTVTLSYLDSNNLPRSVTLGQTLTNAQTLVINWTASADSSGLGDYLVGWTNSATPDPAALTAYASANQPHMQPAGEAQALYAHVAAQDANDNRTWQTLGPVYVDTPNTPDYIADLNYHGWMENGCTQIGADREVSRTAAEGAALHEIQRLYATWSGDALRLTWTGANWDGDGDLFIYLDTTGGGALRAYNPYTLTSPAIGFPPPLAPDYVVWVEDGDKASLRQWNGSTWMQITAWSSQYFQLDTRLSPAHTDVLLSFSLVGNPASLRLAALASEEDVLRTWAAMPDKNPLNSQRVVNPLAAAFVSQPFDLTQDYAWSSLSPGQCPNQGQFADADLRVSLHVEPAGVTVGYLQDDLLDVLSPGARLDANLDGVVDLALPLDVAPFPLGNGATVTYTLTFANEGTAPATNVQINLTPFGGLQLPGGNVIDLGTIPAGAVGTHQFTAQVNAGAGERAVELQAAVSDAAHGDFDWLWAQHPVDRDAPTGLAIRTPLGYVRSVSTTVSGVVQDASGIREVRLEILPQPIGDPITISCPDATPRDGEWSCAWNVTAPIGVTAFRLRAQATDLYGNVSGLSAPVTVLLDNTPPTVSLDPAVLAALADGVLTPGEFIFTGEVRDNAAASAARVCLEREVGQSCTETAARPGTTPVGLWTYGLPVFAADGVTETISIYGRDAAGNLSSTPLQYTFELDNLGPLVTVTIHVEGIVLPTYISAPTPVLGGAVSDANGVEALVVRLDSPSGEMEWLTPQREGDQWSITPEFENDPSALGLYKLRVYAWDGVGNARGYGPFNLHVVGGNAAPTVEAGPDRTASEGDVVILNAAFHDADAQDTHTALIKWGDGTQEAGSISILSLETSAPIPDVTAPAPDFTPVTYVYLPLVAREADPASLRPADADGTVTGNHVYTDNGVYTVEVCVADDLGATGCDRFTVTVVNVAPIVNAGPDQTVDEGVRVNLAPAAFNDRGTRDTHTAAIDWGDGTAVEAGVVNESPFGPPGSAAGANGTVAGSHFYSDNGDYTVIVCVTDDDGATTCDTLAIHIANLAPIVDAGPDQTADEGDVVSLVPATFTDPGPQDTHAATIQWGDGVQATGILTTTPGGPGVPATGVVSGSHVYADNGVYAVEVCVTDDDGAVGCDTLTVTVNNVAPSVEAGHDQLIYEGDTLALDPATFNDKGTLDTHTATIDWGDGAVEAGVVAESPFGPPGSTEGASGTISGHHTYHGPPGVYTVRVRVTDDDGGLTADTLTITVVHGFLRFCIYADDAPGVYLHEEAVLDCAVVPGGRPGQTRPGGVGSRHWIDAGKKTIITGDLLNLNDEVRLHGAQVYGHVTAHGGVSLKQEALVQGNVTTSGDIDLKHRSLIAGDATAGGEVKLDETSAVTGAIREQAEAPSLPNLTPVQFHFSVGAEDVRVESEDRLVLDPGQYRHLKVGQSATLVLHSGHYAFEKFEVEKDAVVEFDLSAGPVVIDVAGHVQMTEGVQMMIVSAGGGPTDILFRVGGETVHLHKNGAYLGTFLAPDAVVKLHDDATLVGALYGRQVDIHEGAHVTGRPALAPFVALFVVAEH